MPYKDKEKQREAQRKWEKENRGAGKRHKVWMFIFYPDTAEVGWRDECDELGLPFLVSPLHDRDVWTAADERRNPDHIEGEVKVAHHHLQLYVQYVSGGRNSRRYLPKREVFSWE